MDPILEDELKRLDIMKQYQDHLDKTDKNNTSEASGELQGKKVKKMGHENSAIENVFSRSVKISSPSL